MPHILKPVSAALLMCFSWAFASANMDPTANPPCEPAAATSLFLGNYGMQVTAAPFSEFASYNNYSFAGHTLYKVYITTANSDDLVVSVYGNETEATELSAPSGIYNSYYATGPTASETGMDVAGYDSYLTIDLTSGPVFPSSPNEEIVLSGTGSDDLGGWFHATNGLSQPVSFSTSALQTDVEWGVSPTAANAVADVDKKVLVMQVNSPGSVSGQLHAVVYPHGVASDAIIVRASFVGSSIISSAVLGCTDVNACNYQVLATENNGSCTYPPDNEVDCLGDCLSDVDGDGVCDGDEIPGCSDASACNFNAAATDEGPCTYPTTWFADADGDGVGDANVTQSACTAPAGYVPNSGDACPSDAGKLDPGDCGCGFSDLDVDGDGLSDCLDSCTDVTACNYDALPTEGCSYAAPLYDCDGVCLEDSDGDGVCNALEVAGCTDADACNYLSSATDEDGSCTYPSQAYLDCSESCLSDADDDGVCDEVEVAGCQDPLACNYDASATDSDGSCTYCDCAPTQGLSPYSLTVEVHEAGGIAGQTTYRLYVNTAGNRDMVNALFADAIHPFSLTSDATPNWYHTAAPFGVNFGTQVQDAFIALEPDLAYDSWFTLGAANAGEAGGLNVELAFGGSGTSPMESFNAGEDISFVGDAVGFNIYTTGTCNRLLPAVEPGACPDDYILFGGADGRVLIGQITTSGTLSGSLSVSVLPEGIAAGSFLAKTFEFNGVGTFSSTDWEGAPSSVYQSCGCTDETAFNYDEDALYLDDSCIAKVFGCTDQSACNYDALANTSDGLCDYGATWYADLDGDGFGDPNATAIACTQPVGYVSDNTDGCPDDNTKAAPGDCGCGVSDADTDGDGVPDCTDACSDFSACNYLDASAAACEYPETYYTCQATCINDTDGDGTCDELEVVGCLDASACNYNMLATESGNCTYPNSGYDCDDNCLVDSDEDGVCDPFEVPGCTAQNACNYSASATDDDGSCIHPGAGYDCNGDCLNDSDSDFVCDEFEVVGCQDNAACNYDATATDAGSCTYPDAGYDCDGVCLNDEDGDTVCDEFEVVGCQDDSACNYNAAATDVGTCVYPESGYNCDGVCLNDGDLDGVCDEFEVVGCQDNTACNYDESATDAGSCEFPEIGYDCGGVCLNDADLDGVCDEFEVPGCLNPEACNFSDLATDEDGSCSYPDTGYDCDGACLNDADGDFVCDEFEVLGCDDVAACNYDDGVTEDDGSCTYPAPAYDCDSNCLNDTNANGICDELEVLGCLDASAANFNDAANVDDGSCQYAGCTDHFACNYDSSADVEDGSCAYAVPGYDCSGNCVLDSDGDGTCDAFEVYGCMDDTACNYDVDATENFCCNYGDGIRDCSGLCLNDADGDGVCDEDEVLGCTDPTAWNYQVVATEDDGFCIADDPETTYDLGYFDGQVAGATIGFNSGYDLGYEEGLAEGQGSGYDAGYADGLLAGAQNCDGQAFCGEGTEWHPDLEVCLPLSTCLGDLDGNAVRGTNDLLLLLSVFGDECE